MDNEFTKDDANSWVAPLPFRCHRARLPNNRDQAVSRLLSLRRTLKRKTDMKDHYVEFMETIFKKGHAETAPLLKTTRNVGTSQVLVFITHKSQESSGLCLIQAPNTTTYP